MNGKLTKQDYLLFLPEIERLIKKHGKIDILLTMYDFHGWNGAALWETSRIKPESESVKFKPPDSASDSAYGTVLVDCTLNNSESLAYALRIPAPAYPPKSLRNYSPILAAESAKFLQLGGIRQMKIA